jgi:hypothetical protein
MLDGGRLIIPTYRHGPLATIYFFEQFRGRKLSIKVNIPTFKPGFDPVAHIHQCENKWRIFGYRDERVWPHMFPNTLDDIPHKWYKIEEACGHTFNWNEIKEKFIRDFEFIPTRGTTKRSNIGDK